MKEPTFEHEMISIAHHKRVDYLRANHEAELSLDENLLPAKEKSDFRDIGNRRKKQKKFSPF